MEPLHASLHKLAAALAALTLLLAACAARDKGFTALTADHPFAEDPQGLRLSLDPADLPSNFKVKLSFTAAAALDLEEWAAARNALPAALNPLGSLFIIQTSGDSPRRLSLTLTFPEDGALPDHLDLYGWTGQRWDFLPARLSGRQLTAQLESIPLAVAAFETGAQVPFTATTLEPGQPVDPERLAALNQVSPAGLRLQADGNLHGGLAGGFTLGQNYRVLPVLRNYDEMGVDTAALDAILRDPGARAAHITNIVQFVKNDGYAGVSVDYHGVDFNNSAAFAAFVTDLAGALHAKNKQLTLVVRAPQQVGEDWATGGYDWPALGAAADFVEIPLGDDPTAPGNGAADQLAAWAVTQISRQKILLATSALSMETAAPGRGPFSPTGYAETLGQFGQISLDPAGPSISLGQQLTATLSGSVQRLSYDEQARADRLQYLAPDNQPRTAWLTSANVLLHRFELARRYHLGGVSLRDLFDPRADPDAAAAIGQYKTNAQAQAGAVPALLWTVTGPDGQTVEQATVEPGRPFAFLARTVGKYLIAARYQGDGGADLGAAGVEVAEVQPTPTPTATPRPAAGAGGNAGGGAPQPAPTSRPPAAPPPVLPPITGNFEMGGQALNGLPAGAMQSAGMKWVKTQARGGDMSGFIASAHGAGFKVLLTVLLDKGRASDPNYWPEVASYAASQVAAGADAIEVWNEMNIDAEWPTGQINPATYVGMLKVVYPAIKAANAGALVISGALAPTGAEGINPAAIMNDDKYLAGMAAAGAAGFMDCVGTHFNSGTTSPSATTGSALSGYHYSYYFWPMVNLYYNTFGGARQLCFTELGYLSSEGYGPLPPAFSWAANTTVTDQANWLAESASLAAGSGKVRLMIVWNVDSTYYGSDPQAGYAIIRPGGGCPACGTLGAISH